MIGESTAVRSPRAGGRLRKRLAAAGAATVLFCTGMFVVSQPAEAAACATVHIISVSTGLVVSAELSDTGIFYAELRARANTVGPWELFTQCYIEGDVFTLQSQANHLFVSTEEDYEPPYQYMLRARASTVGPWEKFIAYNIGGDDTGFTGSPGYWVSSDYNFGGNEKGLLISNRRSLGSWESWFFHE